MPSSKYKALIEFVKDEEITRLNVCLDLHSISPEQYPSIGSEIQEDGITVVECVAYGGSSEFPMNTNYSFRNTASAEATNVPIYCDAGLSKCKIEFNASNDLLNKFEIFTSTYSLSTTPESKLNRYTGDKDVYIFFKSKNDNYSIFSPGKTESEYTFAEGKSVLISGHRGESGHICRLSEPIPKETIKALASTESSILTVDLLDMESLVWESVSPSSSSEFSFSMKYPIGIGSQIYASNLNLTPVPYEPKTCYAIMGRTAGTVEMWPGQADYYSEFVYGVPSSGSTLNMPIVSAPTNRSYNSMAQIGYSVGSNGTRTYKIGMYYSGSNNSYTSEFFTLSGFKPTVGDLQVESQPTYIWLKNVFVSKFDDAYIDGDK